METLNQLLVSGEQLAHHAYALLLRGKDTSKKVLEFLKEKLGVEHRGNPDVFVEKYELLTIDQARALKEMHATRPFAENGKKFFIIEAEDMTHEAQNALLKIFEEPNDYAHFFIIISSEQMLLPTLRSRLFIVHDTRSDLVLHRSDLVQNFLKSTLAQRITIVDELAADISDQKKPKSAAIEFVSGLSDYLKMENLEINASKLAILAETESYLRDRSPSVKQLLEYVALSV
ncbi:MAG: hypothetical protein KGJ35_01550 [Patescibacteria group bacterium]|nr:hypothetical protein [Patescibacteria group bacterium]